MKEKFGFKRKLYQGSYWLIKKINIRYDMYSNEELTIFKALNNRDLDFGWGKENIVGFDKNEIGFYRCSHNKLDSYGYGRKCTKEELLEQIDDIIETYNKKDDEETAKLYMLYEDVKRYL